MNIIKNTEVEKEIKVGVIITFKHLLEKWLVISTKHNGYVIINQKCETKTFEISNTEFGTIIKNANGEKIDVYNFLNNNISDLVEYKVYDETYVSDKYYTALNNLRDIKDFLDKDELEYLKEIID